MERIKIGALNEKDAGKSVLIKGWVDTIRAHGKLVFMDIRDISGIVQAVVSAKENAVAFENAKLPNLFIAAERTLIRTSESSSEETSHSSSLSIVAAAVLPSKSPGVLVIPRNVHFAPAPVPAHESLMAV